MCIICKGKGVVSHTPVASNSDASFDDVLLNSSEGANTNIIKPSVTTQPGLIEKVRQGYRQNPPIVPRFSAEMFGAN